MVFDQSIKISQCLKNFPTLHPFVLLCSDATSPQKKKTEFLEMLVVFPDIRA